MATAPRPRFTKDALKVLLDEVDHYKPVLMSKLTNKATNIRKEKTWKLIVSKVNAVSVHKMTAKKIKKKWHDFSSRAKGKEAERRHESVKTGGGNKPKDLDELELRAVGILGDIAISGISGAIDSSKAQSSEESEEEVGDETENVDDDQVENDEGVDDEEVDEESGEEEEEPRVLKTKENRTTTSERLISLEEDRLNVEKQRLLVETQREQNDKTIIKLLERIASALAPQVQNFNLDVNPRDASPDSFIVLNNIAEL